MRQTPRDRRRALCTPAVIGVLLVLGGCSGSGGDSLPSRTASAELPTVSISIDRTDPATSTTVEAPTTEPAPARSPILSQPDTAAETTPPAEDTSTASRTPPIASTEPATTQVTQTTQTRLSAQTKSSTSFLKTGWRPMDVALLTVGSRHPEQVARQDEGQDEYWASFWDDEQVFYGHVLGFKGLERAVVVLALNEAEPRERSRERLYVGLSRGRHCLVVVGDPGYVQMWVERARCDTSGSDDAAIRVRPLRIRRCHRGRPPARGDPVPDVRRTRDGSARVAGRRRSDAGSGGVLGIVLER